MAKASSTFPGYAGTKKWLVSHPRQAAAVRVTAPTAQAAIVAAASVWGVRWQSVEFYAYASVTPA